ncbi:MAG: ECF transporter S component [Lawsonibacter sp.]
MTDKKLHRLVLAALFTALTTVMTMVIQVPSPMQGYVNLGDCGVLLSAWVLGPRVGGGAAAGIGSMLADLLSGYAHYAPGTLVIKTCMAVAAALILRAFQRGTAPLWRDSWPGVRRPGPSWWRAISAMPVCCWARVWRQRPPSREISSRRSLGWRRQSR